MQNNVIELTLRLLRSLDNNYNVVDMPAVIEIISVLEKVSITKELLENTRLGRFINELRKKTSNESLSKRARELVKKWKNMLLPDTNGQVKPTFQPGQITEKADLDKDRKRPAREAPDHISQTKRAKINGQTTEFDFSDNSNSSFKDTIHTNKINELKSNSTVIMINSDSNSSLPDALRQDPPLEQQLPKKRGRKKGSKNHRNLLDDAESSLANKLAVSSLCMSRGNSKVKTTQELIAGLQNKGSSSILNLPPLSSKAKEDLNERAAKLTERVSMIDQRLYTNSNRSKQKNRFSSRLTVGEKNDRVIESGSVINDKSLSDRSRIKEEEEEIIVVDDVGASKKKQMPQIVQQFQQIPHSQPITPPICQPNSIPMSQAQHLVGPPTFTQQGPPQQQIQPQNVMPLPQISQVTIPVAAHSVPQAMPLNLSQIPSATPINLPPQQYVTTPHIPQQVAPTPLPPASHVHHVSQPMMLNVGGGANGNVDMVTPTAFVSPQIGDITSPPIGNVPGSVSVQNIAMRSQATVQNQNGGQNFQPQMPQEESLPQNASLVKKMPDSIKQIMESNSNKGSQASTPTTDAKFDVHLQSLQQKLSSSLPLNRAALGVDVAGSPHSGAATSEVLSPVVELEHSPFSSLTDASKTAQLNDLNSQLSRINSRAEGLILPDQKQDHPRLDLATNQLAPKEPDGRKERKISRFKVSVVNEPDPNKLVLPPKEKKIEAPEPVASTVVVAPPFIVSSGGNGHAPKEDKADVKTIINDTFNSLANVLAGSLPPNQDFPSEVSKVREETFEEMLNRQKAELNALMEAHRKQQLEYMEFHRKQTEESKKK